VMAKANEIKSGDELAGIVATSETERVAAKLVLADVPLRDFLATPLIEDEVTGALTGAHDATAFAEIAALTVGGFRELILSNSFPARWRTLSRAILPEMAAAVAKVMGNLDLAAAAAPLRTVVRCRNTIGEAGVFAARIQPNHPTDDPRGILMSTLDGLLLGCGDAVIGVNPATDSVANTEAIARALADLIDRIGAPTQACVLAHVTTQLRALERGAPIDLVFQSVAGTEAANTSFGINLSMLAEARAAVLASHRDGARSYIGENVTYFETARAARCRPMRRTASTS
jgi:ethanolamine ammonia-lyase large subunit